MEKKILSCDQKFGAWPSFRPLDMETLPEVDDYFKLCFYVLWSSMVIILYFFVIDLLVVFSLVLVELVLLIGPGFVSLGAGDSTSYFFHFL